MGEIVIPVQEVIVDRFQPNPFNHGTSSNVFKDVEVSDLRKITEIIRVGWGIEDVGTVYQLERGPKLNSRNFRVDTTEGSKLFKQSRINDASTQDLVNQCVISVEQQGIPVPHLIVTQGNTSYFEYNGSVYCLYDFIETSENFDGSLEELQSIAGQLPDFLKALDIQSMHDPFLDLGRVFITHDHSRLQEVLAALKDQGTQVFDSNLESYLLTTSEKVTRASGSLQDLPRQIGHRDPHPHNVLFDPTSKRLLAFLDFDPLEISQRIRTVALCMHRFARTFGKKTEKQNDIGNTINERARIFLETYSETGQLTQAEIAAIPLVLQDEASRRILHILDGALKNNTEWLFDLPKQLILLKEAELFKDIPFGTY